uniref:Uncharacterized protein n=1 Tax=Oryza glumipatula TaxID=40148 RepID=A0A0D9Z5G6_9ORYZ
MCVWGNGGKPDQSPPPSSYRAIAVPRCRRLPPAPSLPSDFLRCQESSAMTRQEQGRLCWRRQRGSSDDGEEGAGSLSGGSRVAFFPRVDSYASFLAGFGWRRGIGGPRDLCRRLAASCCRRQGLGRHLSPSGARRRSTTGSSWRGEGEHLGERRRWGAAVHRHASATAVRCLRRFAASASVASPHRRPNVAPLPSAASAASTAAGFRVGGVTSTASARPPAPRVFGRRGGFGGRAASTSAPWPSSR